METFIIVIITALVLTVLALLIWLISNNIANRGQIASQTAATSQLLQQLEALKGSQDNVGQILQKSLLTGQQSLTQSLRSNQETLDKLHLQLGQIQGANKEMLRIGSDVRRLQDIMASPKLRGQLGEWSLENILTDIMPQDSFTLQYQFKDGQRIDALVKMPEYSVPIDAKFPLPSFEAMIKAESDTEKARLRRQFQKDVTTHIDKIADYYIRPAEGTLDFALMYIPAENVYYETIINYKDDTRNLLQYALGKKVFPVSPNLLYAYLMTIVMGLHGLQIEAQAAMIRQNLKKLNASFVDFVSNWDTLGGHLRKARSKYDDGQRTLDRFGIELTQIQEDEKES